MSVLLFVFLHSFAHSSPFMSTYPHLSFRLTTFGQSSNEGATEKENTENFRRECDARAVKKQKKSNTKRYSRNTTTKRRQDKASDWNIDGASENKVGQRNATPSEGRTNRDKIFQIILSQPFFKRQQLQRSKSEGRKKRKQTKKRSHLQICNERCAPSLDTDCFTFYTLSMWRREK